MSCYERLWRKVGGEPWTYIIRRWWRTYEILWILGLVALGAFLGMHYSAMSIIHFLAIFAVGTLFGHLFWPDGVIRKEKGK